MKTASVRDLRNEFSKVSKWLDAGETVQILKRGKPYGRILPEKKMPEALLGAMQGSGDIPDDLEAPLPVKWEAAE
jgi:antitoxin (DNA-binding transcriptional repressor) of toxin-antitoxin stability system